MAYESFSRVYDRLMKNADYAVRADRISSVLARYGIHDGLLLDLACGTGSLSTELAGRGYEVIGTDSSPEMLMEARQKAEEAGQNILFLCQKMEETDLYGTVRACVCTLDSLNHLPGIEAVRQTFSRLKNFLDPGGIVIVDVNTLYKHRTILGNHTFVYDENEVYCVWQNTLLQDEATVRIQLDFFLRDGKSYHRLSEHFQETAYSDEALTSAIEENGFRVLERFDEDMKSPVTQQTQRAIYIIGRNHYE